MPLITTALSFLSSIKYWLIGGAVAIALGVGTYYVHEYHAGQAAIKNVAVLQQANKLQGSLDKLDLSAALDRAGSSAAINTGTSNLILEIPTYVTSAQDRSTCITYGLVRVYNAAVGQPDAIPLPAGKSNDACSPVKASALAAGIADNFGTAKDNADQLNKLEAYINSEKATADAVLGTKE